MGVQLREIIPPAAVQPVQLEQLAGKMVAVDAFNAIHQFLATIRQQDGTPLMDSAGRVTSHLSGIFYRNARLLEAGAKVAYVFDGKPPEAKKETIEKRRAVKEKAEERYEAALEEGDLESARKYAQATSRLTAEMAEEAKKLLSAMGIAVVEAPAEGEAQAAWLCRTGRADYAASQDYDSLLFGSPVLLRNLSVSGKRKIPGRQMYVDVPIEVISLEKTLERLGIDRRKLVALGVLVGTDYNPGGVKGIGPKKALALLQKYDLADVFQKLADNDKWTFGIKPAEMMELFLKPDVDENARISLGEMDKVKIQEILCEKHEFSKERIEKTLNEVEKTEKEEKRQKNLSNWF